MGDDDAPVIAAEDMENSITIQCPECGNEGKAPEGWEGLVAECRECDDQFTVTEAN